MPRHPRAHAWLILTTALSVSSLGCSDGPPAGTTDAGDAGMSDGGTSEAGTSDAGMSDAGMSDAGASDAGARDAGSDAGTSDAGTSDAGTSDAGTSDAGTSDAGPSDAGPSDAGANDAGPSDGGASDAGMSDAGVAQIEHVVILLQENHTFDNYFGLYCSGPTGTPVPSPCSGRGCCEQAPQQVPGVDGNNNATTCTAWQSPSSYLDDVYDDSGSPDHDADFEYTEMHSSGSSGATNITFAMDRYLCHNVKYARYDDTAGSTVYPAVPISDSTYPLRTYHSLALGGALADRYFQPIVGASCSNDMFLARARFVFQDNQRDLSFTGYTDQTIGDLLDAKGVSWAVYLGGLNAGCGLGQGYPDCVDLTDDPFNFSTRYMGDATVLRDLTRFATDISGGKLPAVSLLRAVGTLSEHPENGSGGEITPGENQFIKPAIDAINGSPYAANTLILISWDEGGGWFDHVPPPLQFPDGCSLPTTPVWSGTTAPPGHGTCALIDSSRLANGTVLPQNSSAPEYFSNSSHMAGQEYYGTRLPLLALGPFARHAAGGAISHTPMEHSSIVKFIEWNWLGHATGQLSARDAHVNNLGSMLDPALGVPAGTSDTP